MFTMIRLVRRAPYLHRCFNVSSRKSFSSVPRVAIVGSGPAGFYTAQQIIKGHSSAEVDVYERLPVPFGLVRFGIAPDHPDVKNVVNTFGQIAKTDRFKFFGNVDVGRDISLITLKENYTAIVLAYGAADDKVFGIPGEDLNGVLSARSFVGWYNGLPEHRELEPNLDTDVCVVLGQGNVAIDVARILLTPLDLLQKTDITDYAMEALSKSRVKKVYLVGRRGPLHVAFTPAEIREMLRLPDCRPVLNRTDFENVSQHINDAPRGRKRLIELQIKTAFEVPSDEDASRWSSATKEFHLTFLRSPLQFLPSAQDSSKVGAVQFSVNQLEGPIGLRQKAVPTSETEEIKCGLVLRSIGYKSHKLEHTMPFDVINGVVPNKLGRVEGHPGLYCSGWVKRGPIGVLATTMNDAFETGKIIVEDLTSGVLSAQPTEQGQEAICAILKQKGIRPVSYQDWEKLDAIETERGASRGKPREKIVRIDEMINLVESKQ